MKLFVAGAFSSAFREPNLVSFLIARASDFCSCSAEFVNKSERCDFICSDCAGSIISLYGLSEWILFQSGHSVSLAVLPVARSWRMRWRWDWMAVRVCWCSQVLTGWDWRSLSFLVFPLTVYGRNSFLRSHSLQFQFLGSFQQRFSLIKLFALLVMRWREKNFGIGILVVVQRFLEPIGFRFAGVCVPVAGSAKEKVFRRHFCTRPR